MRQGDIYMANLEPTKGSEQKGARPVVIISGNTMNQYFNVVICCPISSHIKNYAGCIVVKKSAKNGLEKDSEIIGFEVRSLSKERLGKKIGSITPQEIECLLQQLEDVLRM